MKALLAFATIMTLNLVGCADDSSKKDTKVVQYAPVPCTVEGCGPVAQPPGLTPETQASKVPSINEIPCATDDAECTAPDKEALNNDKE